MLQVLLFDIDGTLVRTGGAGKAAVEDALRELFQIEEIIDNVPYSGRTDRAILHDVLRVHGIPPTPEAVERFSEGYLERLPRHLAHLHGQVCQGIENLLAELKALPHIRLGLLTGNVRKGAMRKLQHFDLWNYFPFGGFGDGHTERNDVARSALQEAERFLGQSLNPKDIWVIGDTPLDVACARSIGAKAVAVSTGWTPHHELLKTDAELVLDHLGDRSRLPREWFISD